MAIQDVESIHTAWDQLASGYNEFITPTNIGVAEEALHRVQIRAGMRVLDVAAGSGALSIPAARLGAQVLATDIAPMMIEQLVARARAEGLSNLEARVMDGQALDLEDDTFDITASQFGVMLFPDLSRGLSEMTRVTRPGGQVLMVTFGPFSQVEFISFFIRAIQATVPGFTGFPSDEPPLPFQVSDEEVLRQKLSAAGLKNIQIEPFTARVEVRSGTQLYDAVTHSNPIGAMLAADLSEEQQATVRQTLDTMLRERAAGSETAILTHPVIIGIGTKEG